MQLQPSESSANRPSDNRPSANRPSDNRSSANRPSANRPSASRPPFYAEADKILLPDNIATNGRLEGVLARSLKVTTALLPWASQGVLLSPAAAVATVPLSTTSDQQLAYVPAPLGDAIAQNQALLPQVELVPTDQIGFSTVTSSVISSASSSASSSAASTPSTSLLTQGPDGSWTLTYAAQNAQQTQAAVSEIAQATRHARQNCTGGSCKGLEYIDTQLPKARQEVEILQSKIKEFENTHAQQDIAAYKQVLASRQVEIATQKSALVISAEQTQQDILALKIRLAQMGAMGGEVHLADQILAQDADYQSAWKRLQLSERSLLEEFSSATIDATSLNEIYGDYQFQQQALYGIADEALGHYLSNAGDNIPAFVEQAPASLSLLQSLVVMTYESQVEQLRLGTIAQIEQKLETRQRELAGNIGEYEQLQRQLTMAQQLVNQYEQQRSELLSASESSQGAHRQNNAQNGTQTNQQNNPQNNQQNNQQSAGDALNRARLLVPLLPEGSVAQEVIYAILAAGAVAMIAAYRNRNQPMTIPQLALHEPAWSVAIWPPKTVTHHATVASMGSISGHQSDTNSPFMELFGLSILDGESVPDDTGLEDIFTTLLPKEDTEETTEAYEKRILAELLEITGRPLRMVESPVKEEDFDESLLASLNELIGNKTGSDDIESFNQNLSIEIMTRDLQDFIQQSTAENDLARQITARNIESVTLSLEDIDAFAEQAINWAIKDLNLSPLAVELDLAEMELRNQAEMLTSGQNPTRSNEAIAVGVKHPRTLAEAAAI
ncbi:MAG: TSC-22/dip/bun family [Phormidesmis priestleyi Ana]|uniref:TSC-22/dip/bun family n=1 Tax=Phormidesmis priestleyi Ana TaxID=1666911 RepID=A0A0P7YRY9_9CYAN|nr:MAG: TSC-22/dip/bun family [Phormidesmis priestleyi Ana]